MLLVNMRRPSTIKRALPSAIPYEECPAKTFQLKTGEYAQGRTVLNHCQIVGEVARELIARYPDEIGKALFPNGAILAAAAHDIGKVSPCFVEKIRRACTDGMSTVTALPDIDPQLERGWGGHAGVSQLTAKSVGAPDFVPEILGQHHGFSPSLGGLRAGDENFGGVEWQKEREALLKELKLRLNSDWPYVDSIAQARLLAGLTSVSDWIGSGQFFEDPKSPWKENITNALDVAGFLQPSYQAALSFSDVFSFSPRPAQEQFINSVRGPGVYVLEAPMGIGKTEAALFAAYRLLDAGEASGIYFALPSQLTSNKIYERFNRYLLTILSEGSSQRSLLLHSNAWLLETDLGEDGRPGGSWFNSSKRGLLAPFAVGTVDQALMAAMNVKHGFVRAFGLAGKVVILDEVHTYDAYTGTLLDALIALLRDLHCTVIILSATLNHERREKLLDCKLTDDAYPLITAVPKGSEVFETHVNPPPSSEVSLTIIGVDEKAVEEALRRAEQGEQVLWIENTVAEAQERYFSLAARASEINVVCGLLHSRYTVDDRQALENEWVNLFGKPGWGKRLEQGRILIGTQVLEQSIDIDADFLVSRFAPTDMLLQRLGRLWRSDETKRCATAIREAWLLAPTLDSAVSSLGKAFGSSSYVYSPYVLCRSLEAWVSLSSINLPTDIRALIEDTYRSREDGPQMLAMLAELEHGTKWRQGRLAMQQLAKLTLSEVTNTLPESKVQTRYSTSDSLEVLLLKNLTLVPEERVTQITLLDDRQLKLPWNKRKLTKIQLRELTAILMRQLVTVRPKDAPEAISVEYLKRFYLHHCFYLGHPDWPNDESVLRIALMKKSGILFSIDKKRPNENHELTYRNNVGYQITKGSVEA